MAEIIHDEESKESYYISSMAPVEALCLGNPIEILGQSAVQHWQNPSWV